MIQRRFVVQIWDDTDPAVISHQIAEFLVCKGYSPAVITLDHSSYVGNVVVEVDDV